MTQEENVDNKTNGVVEERNEEFENEFEKLKEKYEKFEIHYYKMEHIGIMCLTLLFFKIENNDITDKNYHLFIPFLHNNHTVIPNRYFLQKISEEVNFITTANKSFWDYCLKNHFNDFIFIKNPFYHNKYSQWEMTKRCMNFGVARINKPLINFTFDELQFAKSELRRFGIEDKPYICFSNRDNTYYQYLKLPSAEDAVSRARNANVENYRLMAKLMLDRGIYSIRMGHQVERGIEGKGIVDYASHFRSEFMDLYLMSSCRFAICGASGIQLMATLFFTPLVLVNFPVISFKGDMVTPLNPERDLMILKKFWNKREQRYLSIREILRMERAYPSYNLFQEYEKRGIEFQENTPEELAEVCLEMELRLSGKMKYTISDEKLQLEYRKILYEELSIEDSNYYNARIGLQFLKKNPWLLL